MAQNDLQNPDQELLNLGASEDSELEAMGAVEEVSTPNVDSADAPSALESFGRGAVQGGSFSLGDELGGGVQAAMDKLYPILTGKSSPTEVNKQLASQGFTGDIGPQSTLDLYREARDQERVLNEQAKTANPGAYIGGQIGAGILAPGMGAAAAQGTGRLANIGAQAASGALLGGAIAAGESTADISGLATGQIPETQVLGEFGQDVGTGAITGGVAGSVIGTGAEGLKLLPEKSKYIANLLETFRRAKKGEKITGATAVEQAAKDTRSATQDTFKLLEEGRDQAKKMVDDTLQIADGSGIEVNMTRLIDDFVKQAEAKGFSGPGAEQDMKFLNDLIDFARDPQTMRMKPSEVNAKIKEFRSWTPAQAGDRASKQSIDFIKQATSLLEESAPGFAKANKEFSHNLSAIEALTKGDGYGLNLAAEAGDDVTRAMNIMNRYHKSPEVKAGVEEGLEQGLKSRTGEVLTPAIKDVNPKAVTQFREEALDASGRLALSKEATAKDIWQTLYKSPYPATELAGNISRTVGKVNKDFVSNGARKLSDMTPEGIRQFAEGLRSSKAGQIFADMIERSSEGASRNAMIYTLMQQPEFRELARPLMEPTEEVLDE